MYLRIYYVIQIPGIPYSVERKSVIIYVQLGFFDRPARDDSIG